MRITKLRTKLVPLALVGVVSLAGCGDGTDDPVTDDTGIDIPDTTLLPDDGTTDTSLTTETTMLEDTSTTG